MKNLTKSQAFSNDKIDFERAKELNKQIQSIKIEINEYLEEYEKTSSAIVRRSIETALNDCDIRLQSYLNALNNCSENGIKKIDSLNNLRDLLNKLVNVNIFNLSNVLNVAYPIAFETFGKFTRSKLPPKSIETTIERSAKYSYSINLVQNGNLFEFSSIKDFANFITQNKFNDLLQSDKSEFYTKVNEYLNTFHNEETKLKHVNYFINTKEQKSIYNKAIKNICKKLNITSLSFKKIDNATNKETSKFTVKMNGNNLTCQFIPAIKEY